MTGFNSKRKMAQAKVEDDDDTQVYADTLRIVYQRGYADGKQAAQRKPLTEEEIRKAIKTFKADEDLMGVNHIHVARAIEAAHNIKEQP